MEIKSWSQVPSIPKPDWPDDQSISPPQSTRSSPNFWITNQRIIKNPFQQLTPNQLADAIRNPLAHSRLIVIVDARFSYEFQGGKIRGAINVNSFEGITKLYKKYLGRDVSFIFHCEFSRNRGPTIMRQFREYDRMMHQESYPELAFPNLYLLEGGYSNFYSLYPELCEGGYTQMRDKKHVENGDLPLLHSLFKKEIQFPRMRHCLSQPNSAIRSLLTFPTPQL